MSLSFAGVDLSYQSVELRRIMERWWLDNAPDLWSYPGYLTQGMQHLPIPYPPSREKARLNTLVWPNGASRWAVFHSLVGGAQAAAIETAINVNSPSTATLLISDDDQGTSVSPDMYLLAFRPVFVQGIASSQLWWITLVDERYYWWQKNLVSASFTSGISWSSWIYNLLNSVNVTPIISSVATGYGNPSYARWTQLTAVPLPLIIDAAVTTIGQRVVRDLLGNVSTVLADDALTADTTQYEIYQSQLGYGGKISINEIAGTIPSSVNVSYWDVSSQGGFNTTLGSIVGSLPEDYTGYTGVPNAAAWIQGDIQNGAASTYATQASIDYYKWKLSLTDGVFRSVQPWTPTGLEDRIEWEYMPGLRSFGEDEDGDSVTSTDMPLGRVITRIVRSNWADTNIYGNHSPRGIGFEAQLTSAYSSLTGYSWKRQQLQTSPLAFGDPAVALTGNTALSADNSTSLTSGTNGWLEPSPDGEGWIFIAGGSGGGGGGGGTAGQFLDGATQYDCFKVTVVSAAGDMASVDVTQVLYMQWSSGDQGWKTTTDFNICGATGPLIMKQSTASHMPEVSFTHSAGSGSGSGTYIMPWSGASTTGGLQIHYFGAGNTGETVLCPPGTAAPGGPASNRVLIAVTWQNWCGGGVGAACCTTDSLSPQVCIAISGAGAGEWAGSYQAIWNSSTNAWQCPYLLPDGTYGCLNLACGSGGIDIAATGPTSPWIATRVSWNCAGPDYYTGTMVSTAANPLGSGVTVDVVASAWLSGTACPQTAGDPGGGLSPSTVLHWTNNFGGSGTLTGGSPGFWGDGSIVLQFSGCAWSLTDGINLGYAPTITVGPFSAVFVLGGVTYTVTE